MRVACWASNCVRFVMCLCVCCYLPLLCYVCLLYVVCSFYVVGLFYVAGIAFYVTDIGCFVPVLFWVMSCLCF